MYHYKPCVHTNSLYIQDNQKPLKVVNTASPYCSFEDCATKLNYEYAWLIYQAEVNIVNIDFTMHDIKETGARSTSGHTFKQAIPPTDLVEAYLSVRLFSFFLFFFFLFFFSFFFWKCKSLLGYFISYSIMDFLCSMNLMDKANMSPTMTF